MPSLANVWDLIARDMASPVFNRVAESADRAAVATERAGVAAKTSGGHFGGLGKAIIGLGLADLGVHMAKMAGDFQQNTNVLVTAAGELPKNLALVRKGILDIATSTGTDWRQVTEGMYVLEKAGYRGAAALQVEKAAAQGAREEGASLAVTTNALTSIMASYHLPASRAVATMNQMKTAAGESKTTMEAFAGALSTVLPLASANHISFAGVAGVLATLTQHGVSADQATQELAFSIRGLAAPNQVAVKEMAQLGISSVDVSKKLGDGPGGRGLAGTLNYLSQVVLKRMGPSGTLLLSTLNASKVAAHDADLMYAKLPPAVQKLADEYRKGTITSKDYNKAVGELPGTMSNLGRQWRTTTNQAHGFQQAIKNGVNGSQTYSDAIKKMTGGANGLNVVLQATGDSMAGTNERIKRIADSANGAGTNVSGWASTQKLFNVQLDMFKQTVDRVFIELGTKLLPVFSSMIGAVRSAIQWFDGLSSGWKTFAGDALLVVVGLTAVSKIMGTIANSTLVKWASSIIGSFTSVKVAAAESGLAEAQSVAVHARWEAERAAASAEAAVKIAASLEGTNSMLAASATAAAESAIEFSAAMDAKAKAALEAATTIEGSLAAVTTAETEAGAASSVALGPIGLAVTGIVGVIGLATKGFGLFGGSEKAQVKPTDEFTQAILRSHGAITQQTRDLIISKLNHEGAYDAALKLGIGEKTLTDAVLGNAAAHAIVKQKIDAASGAIHQNNRETDAQMQANSRLRGAIDKVNTSVGDATDTLNVNRRAAEHLAAANGQTLAPALDATQRAAARAAVATQGSSNAMEHAQAKAATLSGAVNNTLTPALIGLSNPHPVNLDTSQAMANLNALLAAIPATMHINVQADMQAHLNSMIPGHALGGYLDPGWNLVGEHGPELLNKTSGQVIPANKTPAAGSDAMINELRRTTAAVQKVGNDVAAALNGTARTAALQAQTMPAGRVW